jgi:purine-binding chemotaxis protein CheW
MTSTTLATPERVGLSPVKNSQTPLKLIMFSLQTARDQGSSLLLGVRIEAVDRILGQSQIYSSGRSLAGILHLDDRDITVIDLSHKIRGMEMTSPEYVVVLRTQAEPIGIPLTEPPALVEALPANIRQLPAKYRQLDELRMATQVAQVEVENQILTVFLIDPTILYEQM